MVPVLWKNLLVDARNMMNDDTDRASIFWYSNSPLCICKSFRKLGNVRLHLVRERQERCYDGALLVLLLVKLQFYN